MNTGKLKYSMVSKLEIKLQNNQIIKLFTTFEVCYAKFPLPKTKKYKTTFRFAKEKVFPLNLQKNHNHNLLTGKKKTPARNEIMLLATVTCFMEKNKCEKGSLN